MSGLEKVLNGKVATWFFASQEVLRTKRREKKNQTGNSFPFKTIATGMSLFAASLCLPKVHTCWWSHASWGNKQKWIHLKWNIPMILCKEAGTFPGQLCRTVAQVLLPIGGSFSQSGVWLGNQEFFHVPWMILILSQVWGSISLIWWKWEAEREILDANTEPLFQPLNPFCYACCYVK